MNDWLFICNKIKLFQDVIFFKRSLVIKKLFFKKVNQEISKIYLIKNKIIKIEKEKLEEGGDDGDDDSGSDDMTVIQVTKTILAEESMKMIIELEFI